MILKVAPAQPVFDRHNRNLQKSKDGLNKRESGSFASILENIIKSQPMGKRLHVSKCFANDSRLALN